MLLRRLLCERASNWASILNGSDQIFYYVDHLLDVPTKTARATKCTKHSQRGKKTRQTEEEVGRRHQGMDRPGVCQVPESSGEQKKMEETGCEVICGAPTTLAVKG